MSYDTYPPNGLDRADGLDGRPGTATPSGAISYKPSPTWFEELPSSPEIERGEQGTLVHTFKIDRENGLTLIAAIGRGTILTDSGGNVTKVLTNTFTSMEGGGAQIRMTAESLSFDVPIDEFTVDTLEFNPSIFRHPRYISVLNYIPAGGRYSGQAIGNLIISWITQAVDLPQINARNENYGQLNSSNIPDADVLALAQELTKKLRQGEDTFYLAGFKVQWTQYFYLPPDINPGGYIEDPVTDGGLPYYFWSDDGTPSGNNIFTHLAATIAPQFYALGLSWLRLADVITYQRTWFRTTHTWIGGPYGQWDTDIYDSGAP